MSEYQIAFHSTEHGNGTKFVEADSRAEAYEQFLESEFGVEADAMEVHP